MSESSSPAACPDGRATNMDAEAEAEAQADAESESLVRDIVLCQARAIGSSDKKRSRSRKPKPKSSKKARQLPSPPNDGSHVSPSVGKQKKRRRRKKGGKASSPQPESLIPPYLNPAFTNRPHTSDTVPIGAVHGIQYANGREAVESVASSHNDMTFQLLLKLAPVTARTTMPSTPTARGSPTASIFLSRARCLSTTEPRLLHSPNCRCNRSWRTDQAIQVEHHQAPQGSTCQRHQVVRGRSAGRRRAHAMVL